MEKEVSRRARKYLGQMVAQVLDRSARNIKWLSGRTGIGKSVLHRLIDGVPNPKRSEFEKVIGVLEFSKQQKREAFRLLDAFSPARPTKRLIHRFKKPAKDSG